MKIKKVIYLFISLLISISLFGCAKFSGEVQKVTNTSSPSSSSDVPIPSVTESPISAITQQDFDVTYDGLTLNGSTSLTEMANKLNVHIGEVNSNTEIKAGSKVKGINYTWYILHYPSKQNEKMTIEYIYRDEQKTGRIVSIDLYDGTSHRGVKTGDTLQDIKDAYGQDIESGYNSEDTNYVKFDFGEFYMFFIYDNNSKKINDISIDYDTNSAMDEMGIVAFD